MKWLLLGSAGIAALALALGGLGSRCWSKKTQALLKRLEGPGEAAAVERFDPRELEGLPAPVARHLRQALPPGAPIIRTAELMHAGTFDTSPTGGRWKPFTSRQRVVTRPPGFLWDGRVAMAPGLAVHVHDAYVAGEGILEAALLGLFPLVTLRDRGEVARGELMRFMAEAAWYPTALLPGQGVLWEPIDSMSARATRVDGDVRVSMTFRFGADGMIAAVRAEDRGRMVENRIVPTPWEGRFFDYGERDGLRVPLQGEVAWVTPQGRQPYWRGRITALTCRP